MSVYYSDKRLKPKPQDVDCYLPSPEKIAEACEKISSRWTDRERLKRMGVDPDSPMILNVTRVMYDHDTSRPCPLQSTRV